MIAPAVPRRPRDITAAMVNAVTGRTDVTAVRVADEDHGTAIRARLDVTGAPGLPARVFVKLTPTKPAERAFNALMRLGRNEVDVYRLLGPELGDVMPAYYGGAWDRARSLVIVEDLTLQNARFGDVAGACTADEAAAVAVALARVHARFWESPRFATDLVGFTPPAARTLSWGPQTSRLLPLMPRKYHDVVPQQVREDSRVLRTRRREVAAVQRAFPLTMLHGDTHRGNICFVGNRPVLFDWQVAAQGPGLKDLAYFTVTSLEPDVRRAVERDLLDAYLAALKADSIPTPNRGVAWDDYRMLAVTAYTAAAVTAAFSERLQGEAVTRAGLDRAAQAVTDLDSFALLRTRLG